MKTFIKGISLKTIQRNIEPFGDYPLVSQESENSTAPGGGIFASLRQGGKCEVPPKGNGLYRGFFEGENETSNWSDPSVNCLLDSEKFYRSLFSQTLMTVFAIFAILFMQLWCYSNGYSFDSFSIACFSELPYSIV